MKRPLWLTAVVFVVALMGTANGQNRNSQGSGNNLGQCPKQQSGATRSAESSSNLLLTQFQSGPNGQGGPAGGSGQQGPNPAQLAALLIQKFDQNGDQSLNAQELAQALVALHEMRPPGGPPPGQGQGQGQGTNSPQGRRPQSGSRPQRPTN